MGLIDTTDKAIRLLLSRRFTSDDISIGQEALTSTFDIHSGEVYTDKNLIPTASLPFSGSSQNGSTHQGALKYWYRQKLTKSNINTETWFFLAPIGSDSGITPQVIQSSQQTDFISNKYAIPTLANANAEDSTPGYNVIVYKSTSTDSASLGGGDIVSTNDYQFDYKTGVLQFDANAPSSNDYIYITAYQYIGRTLADEDFRNLFRQTGSFYNTTNNVGITGSLEISGGGNITGNVSSSDALIDDWGSISASLSSNYSFTNTTSASLSSRITDQEAFSSSLNDTFATDVELNTVSASVKTFATDADTTLSASLAVDIATNVTNVSSNLTRIESLTEVTGSYATTGSNNFIGDQDITGDLTVSGIVTAQEFHSEFISASIIFQSGSTKFGDTQDDNHAFTGSLGLSGSAVITGILTAADLSIDDWGTISASLASLNSDNSILEGILYNYTSSTDSRLDSLQAATSSYLVYADLSALNLHTGSANSRLNSIEAATGSYLIYSDLSALNTFTGSASSRLNSLEAATGSYLIYSDLSALNTFTGSANTRLANLEAATSSYLQASDLSSLNTFTGSALLRFNSLEAATGSYVINSQTGSFLVTGSVSENTITLEKADGSSFTLDVASSIFRQTGSIYATTNDIEVSGSLEVNFLENDQEFRISSQSITQFKINNNGIAVFTAQSSEPTFVSGGIYYSNTGAFFLGTSD